MTGNPNEDFKTIIRHPELKVDFYGTSLVVKDGVFNPDSSGSLSSSMLAENAGLLNGKTVLDMGCGSGALAIYAIKHGATKALASDIDEHALENARINVENSGCSDSIETRRSDIFDAITESFDVIFANLPINDFFWGLNSSTLSLAEKFISSYGSHLNDCGVAYLSWASFGDLEGLRGCLKRHRIHYREVVKEDGTYVWYVFILSKS